MGAHRTLLEDVEKQIAKCTICDLWKPFTEFTVYTEETRRKCKRKRITSSRCSDCSVNVAAVRRMKLRMMKGLPPISGPREFADSLEAICTNCGLRKPMDDFPTSCKNHKCLTKSHCISCSSLKRKERRQKGLEDSAEYQRRRRERKSGRISLMLSETKKRAAISGTPFGLTRQWIEDRIESGVCERTGIKFDLSVSRLPGATASRRPFGPSIDRIDSEKGYVPENSQMVVMCYNLGKSTWTDADVLKMAQALVEANTRI